MKARDRNETTERNVRLSIWVHIVSKSHTFVLVLYLKIMMGERAKIMFIYKFHFPWRAQHTRKIFVEEKVKRKFVSSWRQRKKFSENYNGIFIYVMCSWDDDVQHDVDDANRKSDERTNVLIYEAIRFGWHMAYVARCVYRSRR